MGPAMQRNTISGGAREGEDRIDRGGAKLRKEGRMERSGEKVSHLRQDIMDNFLGRDSRPPSLPGVSRARREGGEEGEALLPPSRRRLMRALRRHSSTETCMQQRGRRTECSAPGADTGDTAAGPPFLLGIWVTRHTRNMHPSSDCRAF